MSQIFTPPQVREVHGSGKFTPRLNPGALAALHNPPPALLAIKSNQTKNHSQQRFVLISTAGVLELEKRRPADILAALLSERDGPKLQQFFAAFGAAEAAAMCYLLATSAPGEVPAVSGAFF